MTPSHGAPFRGFRDHSESPFFRAVGRSPEETWNLSVDRLADILETLGPLADAGPIEMSPALLCSWHREIFGELFGADAGRLRKRRAGSWDPEHVYFGGNVGTRQPREIRGYRGTNPRELPRRLSKICTEFNTTAAAIRASGATDTYSAVYAATRLYAKVLRAHPFIDGNLRATTVTLNAALRTLDLARVQFMDLELHDDLLGIAFVGRHDPYRPLAKHIAEIVDKPGEP
ncbi:MAG TPA: Fic family protein [Solirubrobacteraceae bacterium]